MTNGVNVKEKEVRAMLYGPIAVYDSVLYDLMRNAAEMDSASVHHFDTKGDDKFKAKELIGYSYSVIADAAEAEKLLGIVGINPDWARAEFESRVQEGPLNPGTAYKNNETFWSRMLEATGRFSYTYGRRLRFFGDDGHDNEPARFTPVDQIKSALDVLRRDPGTRQAIISVWDASVDNTRSNEKRRIPCSLTYQVFIRMNQVHLCYVSRASDAVSLLASDMYQAIRLTNYFAKELGLEAGTVSHYLGSLHTFKKDWDKAESILKALSDYSSTQLATQEA